MMKEQQVQQEASQESKKALRKSSSNQRFQRIRQSFDGNVQIKPPKVDKNQKS
jgi:hypothetical protein